MSPSLVLTLVSLWTAQTPPEAESPAMTLEAPKVYGGFVGPAVLPPGALSVYGYMGAPEIGAGFRQGVAGVELEVRTRLNYFQVAFAAEALLRFKAWEQGRLQLAPMIGGGFVANTGARWLDEDNFSAISIRILPGLMASVALGETVTGIALLELPFDLGLSPAGTNRFNGLAGGGVEVALDETISVGAVAQMGAERFRSPTRVDEWRFSWQARIGLGFRIF